MPYCKSAGNRQDRQGDGQESQGFQMHKVIVIDSSSKISKNPHQTKQSYAVFFFMASRIFLKAAGTFSRTREAMASGTPP